MFTKSNALIIKIDTVSNGIRSLRFAHFAAFEMVLEAGAFFGDSFFPSAIPVSKQGFFTGIRLVE